MGTSHDEGQGARGCTSILVLVFVLVIAAVAWVIYKPGPLIAPVAAGPVPVSVAAVYQRDVPHLTHAVGTVQSLHNVILRAQVDGVLEQLMFTEGQLVEPGTLMARLDDRAITANLAQARADKMRNEALLRVANLDLGRYGNLLQRRLIPQQTVDQAHASVDQLAAAVAANQAAIANAEVQLSYTRITSPVRGRVGLRRVDPGNLIRANDIQGLVSVTQMDPIAVVFALPQDQWPPVQAQMRRGVAIAVTVSERVGGAVLARGQVLFADNQIDGTSGTVHLKAECPNADERLWPGQLVVVELATTANLAATVIPIAAVQRGLERPFVYRVRADQVEVVEVTIDYQDDVVAVVSGGLALGDQVVTDGHTRLRAGAQISIVPSIVPTHAD